MRQGTTHPAGRDFAHLDGLTETDGPRAAVRQDQSSHITAGSRAILINPAWGYYCCFR